MMVNTGNTWAAMSDQAVCAAIGAALKWRRLGMNQTQAQLARNAGVNRWTVSQMENGASVSLTSLIQIMRALDALHLFDAFREEPVFSPLALAKAAEKGRKRARSKGPSENESEW